MQKRLITYKRGSLSRLPEGYAELSYIQSTGSQYIDTGYVPNLNTCMELKFNSVQAPTTLAAGSMIFGARLAWLDSGFALMYPVNSVTSWALLFGNDTKGSGAAGFNARLNADITWKNTRNLIILDDHSLTLDNSAFTSPCSMYLFKLNSNGVAGGATDAVIRIYYCRIMEDGRTLKYFIPAKRESDGAIGMYEYISNVFYENKDTTDFIAGPVVTLPKGYLQLDYIESTGTQYIDTGVVPTNNTSIDIKYLLTQYITKSFVFGSIEPALGRFELHIRPENFYEPGINNVYAYNSSIIPLINYDTIAKFNVSISGQSDRYALINNSYLSIGSPSAYTYTNSLYIMGCNNTYRPGGYINRVPLKLYYCKIYSDELTTLIRDFVPVKRTSDNVVGLYDLITSAFYTNAGTDTFIEGPESTTGNTVYSLICTKPDIILPDGYSRLEYIESHGTEYIDTGLQPNNNTRVLCEFYTTILDPTNPSAIFGARDGTTANNFNLWITANLYSPQYCNNDWSLYQVSMQLLGTKLSIDFNKNVCSIGSTSVTMPTATFTTNCNLYIFGLDHGGGVDPRIYSGRIYSFSMYNNDSLIFKGIPAMRNSDQETGLYDMVSGEFKTNSGSGSFSGGSVVVSKAVDRIILTEI